MLTGDKLACSKDSPITLHDCGQFQLLVLVGRDRKIALARIDEVVDAKLEILRRHRLHRLCHVRAMMRQFESGLEGARQYMRRILEFVSDFPDAPTTEHDV